MKGLFLRHVFPTYWYTLLISFYFHIMLIKNNIFFLITVTSFLIFLNACKNKNIEHSEDTTEVLVQVYEDTAVTILEDTYKVYGLKKVKVVSRPMYIYLFEFNPKKIKQTELIALLKTSDLVKEAQINRNVETRK